MHLEFPADHNIRFLPLVFFLPEDVIINYPTLRAMPRNLYEILYVPTYRDMLMGDAYLKEIADATAALVFPHFGFSGWIEHYTGYFPVWVLGLR